MKFVEIYKLQNDGEQKLLATCKLDGEIAVCEGDQVFISNLTAQGIRDYSNPANTTRLFPKDGLRFLENLKPAFRSPYLSATEIRG